MPLRAWFSNVARLTSGLEPTTTFRPARRWAWACGLVLMLVGRAGAQHGHAGVPGNTIHWGGVGTGVGVTRGPLSPNYSYPWNPAAWPSPGYSSVTPAWRGGFSYCRPATTVYSLYPAYPYWGSVGYGTYGAFGGTSDLTLALLMQQNARLEREIDQLKGQVAAPADDAARRLNVPLPRKGVTSARATQTRENRARQALAAGARVFAKGNYAKAADHFKEASQASDDATSFFFLGQALFATGRYAEAARTFQQALRKNPDWLEVDFDVRGLYGDPAELLAQLGGLAKELRDRPLDRQYLFVLGLELFLTGQKDKAKTVLEQVARLETDDRYLKPFFDYFAKSGDPLAKLPAQDAPAKKPRPASK